MPIQKCFKRSSKANANHTKNMDNNNIFSNFEPLQNYLNP